jgi:uncharacterized protein YcnI
MPRSVPLPGPADRPPGAHVTGDPGGSRRRVRRRAGVLAVAGALLVAGPASAHPFVRGGELPVDSLATMTLAMAHGCDSETSGEGDPTTDVSMEVPDWLRVVEVAQEDGWAVELEEDTEGVLQVVTWTSDGAEEPAPDFDLDVVASGEVGETLYLRIFQACDEFVYRWVGTPDDPADDPAIGVTLIEPDASAPPPPEPEPEPEPDPESEPAPDDTAGEPVDEDDGAGSEAAADATADDSDAQPPAVEDDGAGLPGWFVPVTIVVLLGALGAVTFARRGRADA